VLKNLIESSVSGRAPRSGDIIALPEPALFCGSYKGKWIVATENVSLFDKSAWDMNVVASQNTALIIHSGFDEQKAHALYHRATKMPFLGSIVESNGMRGRYIRPETYGVEHRIAFEFTQENQDYLARLDLDRIVEVDGSFFGLLNVIAENMRSTCCPDCNGSCQNQNEASVKRLLVLMFLMTSCQTAPETKKEDRPPIPWSEIRPLPAPAEGSVVALPSDGATTEERAAMDLLGIPYDGYVLSESKLNGAIALRLYAEQLHANAVTNTGLGQVWTDIMWRDLAKADAALDEAVKRENTWWNRNKDSIYFGGGFALGAVAAILMAYGLNEALGD